MKQWLVTRWHQLEEKVDARNTRERGLICLSVLALLYLIWEFAFYQPLNQQREELRSRYQAVDQELTKLNAEQQVFVKALSNDPNAARKREVVRLENQLNQIDEQLQTLAVGLIPAEELPLVLHDVLQSGEQLKLQTMRTLPSKKLTLVYQTQEDADAQQADAEAQAIAAVSNREAETQATTVSQPGVFKHGVSMTFEGNYFEVLEYLRRLEKLEWKVYWEYLDYQVSRYPRAVVTLRVYTLSTEEGMFGE